MKKMSKGLLMTALICGTVYWGGTPVHASELQEFTLDEYVVTAARTETKLVDTPANISVVTAEQIESRHYQDVSEVLKDVPGANVLDSGAGAFEKKIMLNGDERVLIMIDGRRLNYDMGTMTRSGYDMNQLPDVGLIERIEVLKGAGGALYGSDAVGGVVNIITKKADRSFGKVSVAMGSMGAEDYNAMYSMKEGKTGVTVSASKYEQDYYKYKDAKSDTTKRWPGESNFKDEKISLKLEQELNSESNIEVGYDYSKFEGWNPYTATSNGGSHSYVDRESKNLYAKYNWVLNEKDHGYFQYYHNEMEYSNVGASKEKTNGLDLQQAFSTVDNNKVVVGVSYRKSDVNSNYIPYGDTNEVNNYDDDIENMAVFINDSWEFAPTWTLNAGARYDDHSEAGDDTTLSFGLNKKFNDESHVYINWGQVFRAPTLDDLYYNNYDVMNFGNPDLKPETGETWTIGYDTKLNDKTYLGISYFESKLEDAINWVGSDWITTKYGSYYSKYYATNVDEQEKRGIELTMKHNLNNNVDIQASYTYIRVKNSYDDQGFLRDYHYAPNTYRLGLNYHDGKWDTNVWLRAVTGASAAFNARYSPYYGTTSVQSYLDENYLTVDMAVTYKASEDFNIFAKAYNLFNESYAEQAGTNGNGSYDYPAQARRFIVGAEYKF